MIVFNTAGGDTTAVQQYEAWHDKAVRGNNYYRLKQFDLDGKMTIFITEKVVVGTIEGPGLAIYPNPVQNGTINLSLFSATTGLAHVTIKDINGKQSCSVQSA